MRNRGAAGGKHPGQLNMPLLEQASCSDFEDIKGSEASRYGPCDERMASMPDRASARDQANCGSYLAEPHEPSQLKKKRSIQNTYLLPSQ